MNASIFQSKKTRTILSAVAGFVAYGGWAYVANMHHGVVAGIKAACTQGSFSFILTLFMNGLMEWCFHRISGDKEKVAYTILLTSVSVYSASWGVNYLAGTPEILMTVLPGWFFSTIYVISYTLALRKITQQQAESNTVN